MLESSICPLWQPQTKKKKKTLTKIHFFYNFKAIVYKFLSLIKDFYKGQYCTILVSNCCGGTNYSYKMNSFSLTLGFTCQVINK